MALSRARISIAIPISASDLRRFETIMPLNTDLFLPPYPSLISKSAPAQKYLNQPQRTAALPNHPLQTKQLPQESDQYDFLCERIAQQVYQASFFPCHYSNGNDTPYLLIWTFRHDQNPIVLLAETATRFLGLSFENSAMSCSARPEYKD